MTQELRTQRDELVNASHLIDSRRRFIEAVLRPHSAGIIGVDDAAGSVIDADKAGAADDSTASMKRRRLSMRSLALTSSSRWVRNSCVHLVKVSPSCARSPSDLWIGTCTCRLPVETRAGGAHHRLWCDQPIGEIKTDQTEALE